jgi:hypothetical protein
MKRKRGSSRLIKRPRQFSIQDTPTPELQDELEQCRIVTRALNDAFEQIWEAQPPHGDYGIRPNIKEYELTRLLGRAERGILDVLNYSMAQTHDIEHELRRRKQYKR